MIRNISITSMDRLKSNLRELKDKPPTISIKINLYTVKESNVIKLSYNWLIHII